MAKVSDAETSRLDDAARAGWLYYVAGNTQDEIARKLGISRQSAQRLVSLAMSERLIKVRLDHPIARCLELGAALAAKFGLKFCEIAPTDPASTSLTLGIAEVAAAEMERWLRSETPIVMAIGTGRTMRAVADQLPAMECPQHKIVALVGNTKADGSASFFDAVVRVSDTARAPHYPLPLPVVARSVEEKLLMIGQESVRHVRALAGRADVTFVGIGEIGENAPLLVDGFLTREELDLLRRDGAIGEIAGWPFDAQGRLIEDEVTTRVASVPLERPARRLVIGVARGTARRSAIRAAVAGGLLSGLVTDEQTAEHLLRR
jgi:DNA-binding transcriptional regulator LsrR (DeoR family)